MTNAVVTIVIWHKNKWLLLRRLIRSSWLVHCPLKSFAFKSPVNWIFLSCTDLIKISKTFKFEFTNVQVLIPYFQARFKISYITIAIAIIETLMIQKIIAYNMSILTYIYKSHSDCCNKVSTHYCEYWCKTSVLNTNMWRNCSRILVEYVHMSVYIDIYNEATRPDRLSVLVLGRQHRKVNFCKLRVRELA